MVKVKCNMCNGSGNLSCQTCRGHGFIIVSHVNACGGGSGALCATKLGRVTGENSSSGDGI